jgi:DNA-binding XRE family transcriptional regulator
MSREVSVPAAEVITVRKCLKLSQAELAERLCVSRRTIIRGEKRGIELPSKYMWRGTATDARSKIRPAWEAARKEAEKAHGFAKLLEAVTVRLEQEKNPPPPIPPKPEIAVKKRKRK